MPEELLADLHRLIELEEHGDIPVIEAMCSFAKQLCSEETTRYALAVAKVSEPMSRPHDRIGSSLIYGVCGTQVPRGPAC